MARRKVVLNFVLHASETAYGRRTHSGTRCLYTRAHAPLYSVTHLSAKEFKRDTRFSSRYKERLKPTHACNVVYLSAAHLRYGVYSFRQNLFSTFREQYSSERERWPRDATAAVQRVSLVTRAPLSHTGTRRFNVSIYTKGEHVSA